MAVLKCSVRHNITYMATLKKYRDLKLTIIFLMQNSVLTYLNMVSA